MTTMVTALPVTPSRSAGAPAPVEPAGGEEFAGVLSGALTGAATDRVQDRAPGRPGGPAGGGTNRRPDDRSGPDDPAGTDPAALGAAAAAVVAAAGAVVSPATVPAPETASSMPSAADPSVTGPAATAAATVVDSSAAATAAPAGNADAARAIPTPEPPGATSTLPGQGDPRAAEAAASAAPTAATAMTGRFAAAPTTGDRPHPGGATPPAAAPGRTDPTPGPAGPATAHLRESPHPVADVAPVDTGAAASTAAGLAASAVSPLAAPARAEATAPPAVAPSWTAPAEQPELAAALGRLRTRGSGTHELTVALHPAELGAVTVTATLHRGELNVVVACKDAAAHEAVTAALPTLHQQLTGALRQVDVTFTASDLAGTFSDGSTGGSARDPQQRAAQAEVANRPTEDVPPAPRARTAPTPRPTGIAGIDRLL